MDILFQSHHAKVSESIRERARMAVMKLSARLTRAVNAIIRFEEDGKTRRVEIVLLAPRRRPMVAEGSARFFGPALGFAIDRLEAHDGVHRPGEPCAELGHRDAGTLTHAIGHLGMMGLEQYVHRTPPAHNASAR